MPEAYVERVGNRVKNASELKDQPFTFTLLDSDVVNAFALPGGYVYVTRGLLALTNNEAELAGVLGHEVGHVTARHTAQRYDRAQAGQIGRDRGAAGGCCAGRLAGRLRRCADGRAAGRQGGLAGGRGLRAGLLARAGVPGRPAGRPLSRGRRLRSRRHGDLPGDAAGQRRLRAEPGRRGRRRRPISWATGSAATRARPSGSSARWPRRARRARARARPTGRTCWPPSTACSTARIRRRASSAAAASSTRACASPSRRRRASSCRTRRDAVVGSDGQGAAMVFDMAPKDVAGDLRGYLQNGWVTRQQLQNLQSIDLGGQPGAVGFGQVSIGGQPAQAMFSAVRGPGRPGLPLPVRETRTASAGPTSPRSSRPCAASGRCRRPRRQR